MCAVSYVSEYARDHLPNRYPNMIPSWPNVAPAGWPPTDSVPRHEFEKLKAEVEELKKLLSAAKAFDEKTDQHECEQAEKVAFLKKLAEFVGVDLSEVLK